MWFLWKVLHSTVGLCLVWFCVVRIWIVRVLKNTPDLHSAYYGFLAFSDHLYYSGTCVVWFHIVWFCIVCTFFWILRAHYARTYCTLDFIILPATLDPPNKKVPLPLGYLMYVMTRKSCIFCIPFLLFLHCYDYYYYTVFVRTSKKF